MNSGFSSIIGSVTSLVSVLLGSWLAFLWEKYRKTQSRIDAILEKRMKVYGESLEFIYEIEQNQTKAEELERIIERWKKWYPSNAIYLPPSVNDALFRAVNWTVLVMVDLYNKQSNRETLKVFKENMQQVKTELMNLKDISWIPKDLK